MPIHFLKLSRNSPTSDTYILLFSFALHRIALPLRSRCTPVALPLQYHAQRPTSHGSTVSGRPLPLFFSLVFPHKHRPFLGDNSAPNHRRAPRESSAQTNRKTRRQSRCCSCGLTEYLTHL